VLYILGFIAFIIFVGLRVISQYEKAVVFRLGKYIGIKGPGLIYLIPIFDRMVKISLRTVTMEIPSQKIITKDNVSIDIAAVAYYKIIKADKSVLEIENVYNAVNQISQTTVRNVIGQFYLDELLAHTSDINTKIKDVIDKHTEPWGVQVSAVEIKDVILPDNMQRAMAKEAEAERE
jgi:regulator of protease activity HflC (stomatin/prohibitin superfamily)